MVSTTPNTKLVLISTSQSILRNLQSRLKPVAFSSYLSRKRKSGGLSFQRMERRGTIRLTGKTIKMKMKPMMMMDRFLRTLI